MKAEIISIGDEILIGQIVNTNAAFLGEQLLNAGIPATRTVVVGDDPGEIAMTVRTALERADVIITTGGLGPTHDDVTRTAIASLFSSSLVFSPQVFEDVEAFFARRGRSMLPAHRDQALVPECATPIRNANGTAPGFDIQRDGRRLFVLPGVPEEMKAMMTDYIMPILAALSDDAIAVRTLLTTGIPESTLAQLLDTPASLPDDVSLAYLPSPFGIRLRVSSRDTDRTAATRRCDAFVDTILDRAGEFVFGEAPVTLAGLIGTLLREHGMRLAAAESCTAGTLASMITDVPGSSTYFDRGVVTYSNASKTDLLEIPASLIEQHGAVSAEVAVAMARGIRRSAAADIGISTTGIAGPDGGTDTKPVGMVWIGFNADGVSFACRYLFGNDRIRTRQRASQAALDLIRRHILGLPRSSSIVSETIHFS
jgi:nicotinamide-nucleotide amidase